MTEKASVLLVEPDPETRDRYGQWLEEAGYRALVCPGPKEDDFTCLGIRGQSCPLDHAAPIVVVDTRRLPGINRHGLPGWRLLRHYLSQGKAIVVIADGYQKDRTYRSEQMAVIHPNPGRESLLLAVRRMLKEAERW